MPLASIPSAGTVVSGLTAGDVVDPSVVVAPGCGDFFRTKLLILLLVLFFRTESLDGTISAEAGAREAVVDQVR